MNHESHATSNAHIPQPWLLLARVALLAISILALIVYVAGIPANLEWFNSFHPDCLDLCMNAATLQTLHEMGISIPAFALYWTLVNLLFFLAYFAVAALIFWRKPDDRMALLAAFALVTLGAAFPSIPTALVDVHPGWQLPVALVGNEDLFGFPSLVVFFFLFPSGSFVPRWTRWASIVFVVLFVVSGVFPDTNISFQNWPRLLIGVAPLLAYGSLVFAQVYRYRRVSTRVERQQTKWIVFGMSIGLLVFLVLGYLLGPVFRLLIPLPQPGLILTVIAVTSIYLVLLLIPLSLALAVLRYRLWDIDVIINRTLVYGLLTGILAVVYAGCIVGSQALFGVFFHQDSQVAIVLSTLVIYILFHPIRRIVQAGIDRRFYRRKYDAVRTLAAFSATLRSEVDLSQVCEKLVAVVQETMQPASISLWLRSPDSFQSRNTRLLPRLEEEELSEEH